MSTPSEISAAEFRQAISLFATGVTIITTTHESKAAGMTASAVASLSLDPLLLLVCVDNRLPTHRAIESSRRFAVNVLGEDGAELALRFARSGADKFAGVKLVEDSDPPLLEDAIAHFVCDVHERLPGGDHSIFVGQVVRCRAIPGRRPLLYFQSSFGAWHDPHAEFLQVAAGWDAASLGGLGSQEALPK
jgi:flavin reductase (DIM6/NTAB) family NADH-FMN oxidoreductase RutF